MEIIEILQRCRECGTGTALLVQDTYMAMDGRMIQAIWRDEPEHTRSDCKRMVTLEREQWPTLW